MSGRGSIAGGNGRGRNGGGYYGRRPGFNGNRPRPGENRTDRPPVNGRDLREQLQRPQPQQIPGTQTVNEMADLRGALQQIMVTLGHFTNRLENLETKNRGPDQPADSRPNNGQAHHQAGPRTTTTQQKATKAAVINVSTSCDFAGVVKGLYRSVQLKHHRTNWTRLPKAIHERLGRLVDDIRPPLPDEDVRRQLKAAADRFADEICKVVSDHLDRKQQQVVDQLQMLDATDCNKAQQIAVKYLSVRPGKRLQQEQRSVFLEEAAAIVGRNRQQAPRPDADGFEFQRKQRHAEVQPSGSLPAREPAAPAPIQISNSFQALQSMVEDVAVQPDVEVEADGAESEARSEDRKRRGSQSTASSTANVTSLSTERRKAIPADPKETHTRAIPDAQPNSKRPCTKSTPPPPPPMPPRRHSLNHVSIHNGAFKDLWSLTPRASTSFLWIGDSNSRQFTNIAPDWEVHAFNGARLDHVADILDRMQKPPLTELEAIVVAIGINYRDDKQIKLDKDLERIKTAVSQMNDIKIYFVLPSYADNLDLRQKAVIDAVHTDMKKAAVCVAALDPTDVFIQPGDKFGIHYDSKTANKIFRRAVSDVIQWQRNIDSVF